MAQRFIAREKLSPEDIWRRFPPEEKIELLTKSHAAGCTAVLGVIGVAITVGVSLQSPTLMWASVICSPLVFQFAAGRQWRRTQPKAVLEYLAARSVARRFAFAINSKELSTRILFKAQLVRHEVREDDLFDQEQDHKTDDVWVALFGDSIIIMAGGRNGAETRLARLLDERIKVETVLPPGEKESSPRREVVISYRDSRAQALKSYRIRSRYPAALVVFEQYLIQQIAELEKEKQRLAEEAANEEPGSDSQRTSYF